MCLLTSLFLFVFAPDFQITDLGSTNAVVAGEKCESNFLIEIKQKRFTLPCNLEVPISKMHGVSEIKHIKIPALIRDTTTKRNVFTNALPIKNKHIVNILLPNVMRNKLKVGPLKVSNCGIFGLFKVSKTFSDEFSVYIYPKHLDLSKGQSARINDFSGKKIGGSIQNSMFLKGVREFMPGDQPKYVHQKISAKYSRPYVKQFESIQSSKTLFIFDNSYQSWQNDAEFEQGISILSSLVRLADSRFTTMQQLSKQVQPWRFAISEVESSQKGHLENNLRACACIKGTHLHSSAKGKALQLLDKRFSLTDEGLRIVVITGSEALNDQCYRQSKVSVVSVCENGNYRKRAINSCAYFTMRGLKDVKRLARDLYA